MASKHRSSDSFDVQNEGDFSSDPLDGAGEMALMAPETEAETEDLRHQVEQQQQQIEKLFRLMSKQRGQGPTGDRPRETAAVRRFRERTKVLKQAYPNTRI